jgi:hypothetical protein
MGWRFAGFKVAPFFRIRLALGFFFPPFIFVTVI